MMKFPSASIFALFASGVLGDLHNFCACGKRHSGDAVVGSYVSNNKNAVKFSIDKKQWAFNTDATKYACSRYALRNTGSETWDSCPDCKMDTYYMDSNPTPSCFSFGFHLGGDEFDYYCGLNGLQGYCKDAD
ncbi:hypothetical protein QIS74_12939 [Colletotrichum tabaci]|uniref:Uncharacterized protein n=1 Tax=Colletotrichum tabaci TaxID=1209068 RepID=A0AAV9SW89_9PEZI